jgi:hypothetical protein
LTDKRIGVRELGSCREEGGRAPERIIPPQRVQGIVERKKKELQRGEK